MSKQRKKKSQPTPAQLAELKQIRLKLEVRLAGELEQKLQEATQLALKFGVNERCSLAEQLEQKAALLRNFKEKEIDYIGDVNFGIRPYMKKVLLLFFKCHTDDVTLTEQRKLNDAARWILEIALTMIETIDHRISVRDRYRDSEGLECSVFTEKLTAEALKNWEEKRKGGYKDSYGYGDDEN